MFSKSTFVLLILLTKISLLNADNRIINIGVLAYDGKDQALARWQPTADYLNELIPNHQFAVNTLNHSEIEQSIKKNKLDFVLTNPGHYVNLEAIYGVTRIATFKSSYQQKALNRFGAVLFTRKDSTIKNLGELRDKTVAAVSEKAFGGYLMARKRLLEIDTKLADSVYFSWFGFPQEEIVLAVMNNDVDAGTVRTGVIEKMINDGRLGLDEIRIIGLKEQNNFPLHLSTDLYPEWPFARLPKTGDRISEQVALALLNMPTNSQAAQISRGAGWTIPADYSAVHHLYKRLQLPPYQPRPVNLSALWQSYYQWILILIALFIICLIVIKALFKTNANLRHSRIELALHQGQLEEKVQERTREMSSLNEILETDNKLIARKESKFREACEILRAMTETSTRQDLSHEQRLQSIVDIACHHMNAQQVVLSSHSFATVKVCATSPNEPKSITKPLMPEKLSMALKNKNTVFLNSIEPGLDYLAHPVVVSDELTCIIEMMIRTKNNDPTDSEQNAFTQELLNLILRWAANELMQMQKSDQEQSNLATDKERFLQITRRERQILELMADGFSNKMIADQLNISIRTIELHRSNLIRKTGLSSALEMIKTATKAGIVH